MNERIQRINLGMVNAYLLRAGEGVVLVDSGVPQSWGRLQAALQGAGCPPDRLRLVIVTHGDGDHTGNCSRLQREVGVRIALHPGDRALVEEGLASARDASGLLGKAFLLLGRLAMGRGGAPLFRPDVWLADGQDLGEYGLAARVIHTPGHTAGSIALLTAEGDLLLGDTVGNYRRPAPAPFVQDWAALRSSLATLRGLPGKTVYPGHGAPFPFEALRALKV